MSVLTTVHDWRKLDSQVRGGGSNKSVSGYHDILEHLKGSFSKPAFPIKTAPKESPFSKAHFQKPKSFQNDLVEPETPAPHSPAATP